MIRGRSQCVVPPANSCSLFDEHEHSSVIRPHFEPSIEIAVDAPIQDRDHSAREGGVERCDAGVGFGDLYKVHSAMPAP